jgi:hypothetical protein
MNVLFVSLQDPGEQPSGSFADIDVLSDALRKQGIHVEILSGLRRRHAFVHHLKKQFYALAGRTYLPDRNVGVAKSYARQVRKRLKRNEIDLVLSLSSIPVARLKTDLPIVTYSNASFTTLKENDDTYANLCLESWRDGARLEQAAFTHVDAVCYTSQWAIDSALQYYSIRKAKLHLVPSGDDWDRTAKQLVEIFNRINN